MLLTIDKVMILRAVGVFSQVPTEHLVDVADALRESTVPAGTRIIQEDEIGNEMYIIVAGAVRVLKGSRQIATLGEGDVFGELAALDPEPRSATVEVTEETVLLGLRNDYLQDLMTSSVEVSRGIVRMLCRRVRTATDAHHDEQQGVSA